MRRYLLLREEKLRADGAAAVSAATCAREWTRGGGNSSPFFLLRLVFIFHLPLSNSDRNSNSNSSSSSSSSSSRMATLERLRSSLEDIEEVDRLIVKELDSDAAKTQREQITSDHKIASYLRAAEARARTCLGIYKDEDGVKKAELELMTGPNALTNFYDQLRESKAYHRRFQTATQGQLVAPLGEQLDAAANAEGKFSGEENIGRYVDLNSFYQRFVNLPGNKKHAKLDYRSYLDIFADFRPGVQGIPTGQKRAAYNNYVGDLHDYLRGFYERCHPLADMVELDARVSEEFTESLSSEGLKQKEGWVVFEWALWLLCLMFVCWRHAQRQPGLGLASRGWEWGGRVSFRK